MDDDNPLVLELASLRQTAARFQHEAHAAAIKLQRHSLESSCLHGYATTLEQENTRLTHELGVLRANPDISPHPAIAQAHELSLALRRVSDKVVLTEDTLSQRTAELTDTRTELARAKYAADGAYELAARMRAREEAAKARERELELNARASDEERKLVDRVVQEYADLVRNLEGRKSANPTPNGSTSTLVDTLQDAKSNLQSLLTAFSTESEQLHATIAELNAKVFDLQITLDAERVTASNDRALLSQTKTELDKLNLEDQTAAKMVARYMKFSQASNNALQQQITTLKLRYASTIATLELQVSIAESHLATERTRTARLQDALDELCEDLARESYGRRREVALRLALLSREEGVAEFMQRWARRARELYARCYSSAQDDSDPIQEAFHRVVSDAESLLSSLDDDVQIADTMRASGSLARITLAREAVEALRSELQDEVQKRVEAVRKSAFSLPNGDLGTIAGIPPESDPQDDRPPVRLTPNGDARPEHETPSVSLPPSGDPGSPMLMVCVPDESIDDPFVVSATVVPPDSEITHHTTVQAEIEFSQSIQDSSSSSATLLVDEESKVVQLRSPAVSVLDLRHDSQHSNIEEPGTVDIAPIHGPPSDTNVSPLEPDQTTQTLAEGTPIHSISISTPVSASENVQVPAEDDISISPSPKSTPTLVAALHSPSTPPSTLLAKLGMTKHRYDTVQRSFRDCSLALKELKRTLASPSSSSHTQTKPRQHLETALARIDDYAEDARVELEIRVADEELTARGFETVLSVPGALVDADERAEVEVSVRAFIDGTDDGVARALERFGKKLEDVQHDVAVVKRAVHGLGMLEDGQSEDVEKDAGGWSAWTAGLLAGNATPTRALTPVQTFGAVMTSPRLRHAASNENIERGPLAGLGLRISMPAHSQVGLTHLGVGLGRAGEGPTRPRTLSAMYAVGGLRSSSIGLGAGLGSPSPARGRGGRFEELGSASSPLCSHGGAAHNKDMDDIHCDLGGVE